MSRFEFARHAKAMVLMVCIAATLAAFVITVLLHFGPVGANVEAKIARWWVGEAIRLMTISFG